MEQCLAKDQVGAQLLERGGQLEIFPVFADGIHRLRRKHWVDYSGFGDFGYEFLPDPKVEIEQCCMSLRLTLPRRLS
jgi:hypothetical protein